MVVLQVPNLTMKVRFLHPKPLISLLTIRIKPFRVIFDASNVSVYPPCGISALSRKCPYLEVRVCTTRDSMYLAWSRSENAQYFMSIQPLVLWAANLLPDTSDIPILIALCNGLYRMYSRVITLLYLTCPANFAILGLWNYTMARWPPTTLLGYISTIGAIQSDMNGR